MTDFNIDFDAEDEVERLRGELRLAYSQLSRAKDRTEAAARAAMEGAFAAVDQFGRPKVTPYVAPAADRKAGKPEVALPIFTDWQGGKKTTTYNSEVMKTRVRGVLKNMMSVVEIQRMDHPVNDCVVLLGGDMLEGLFNFPTQPYEIDATLFEQFVTIATLLDEAVRFLVARFASVKVIAEWGNHGRIGSKRAVVPKGDNADRMIYHLAAAMGKDLPTAEWSITEEDIQRFEIGNYRALLIHGDEVGRNGYASPTTLVKHVTSWKAGGYTVDGKPWDFRDAYMGHYHTHAQWPLPDGGGNLFQTGSIESDNRYARDNLAVTATPSQRLHFVDPRKGRVTAQYQIWTD
jgi:hypothetical protein